MEGKKNEMSVSFSAISLNVRGLINFKKRRTIFNWVKRHNADFVLLQETHSSIAEEQTWAQEWGGEIIFSHGSRDSRGVCILFKKGLDVTVNSKIIDSEGRCIILDLTIQDTALYIVNIYAPNGLLDQITFFNKLNRRLQDINPDLNANIMLGGDFNVTLDPRVDKKGGTPGGPSRAANTLKNILEQFELLDVWRVRNPDKCRFTWKRNNPRIQCRLDYWFIPDHLLDMVKNIDIVPSILTDHSAVLITLHPPQQEHRGNGQWKLNTSLVTDQDYVRALKNNIQNWKNIEFEDDTTKWDFVKYKIREFSISYSKKRARQVREIEVAVEREYKNLVEKFAENPCEENAVLLDNKKKELEVLYDKQTEGAIIRSRAQWHEYGEKSNKYFLNLEKRNQIKKHIRKLKVDDEIITDPKSIRLEQKKFYENLYDSKTPVGRMALQEFTADINVPKLSEEDKTSCEGLISNLECQKVIKEMANNKTPGNDGLPVEFYKIFWTDIKELVINSFNAAYVKTKLSTSQTQAVITLIDKPGKDRMFLKNWRPISLMNVDYKIASKVLALRLKKVIPQVVHWNQTGFVADRYIGDSIRSIWDVMEFTKQKNISGILLALDFEKAFDSLEWSYLLQVLELYNFGPSFLQWIKTLYSGACSCVMNNGHASGYFNLKRGVRQGDPISPYLFLLAIEVLLIKIRSDKEIKGISVLGNELKVVAHADDMTGCLKDVASARRLFKVIDKFGEISGLVLNRNKCEGKWLGPKRDCTDNPLGILWTNSAVKILGIYFSYDEKESNELNFRNKIPILKTLLQVWMSRGLSLLGKITIVKTFAISKFLYVASVLPVSGDTIQEINKLLFNFIWSGGSEKIKRGVLSADFSDGGLRMLDMKLMIEANRIMWMKRFLDTKVLSFWKYCAESSFKQLGGIHLLARCNFDQKSVRNKCFPGFYEEVLCAWRKVMIPCESLCWNNREIKAQGLTLFWPDLYNAGVSHCSDLFHENGDRIGFQELAATGIEVNKHWLKLWGLIMSIPENLRSKRCTCKTDPNEVLINLGTQGVRLSKVSSKQIYTFLVKQVSLEIPGKARIANHFGRTLDTFNWQEVFLLPHQCVKEAFLRSFQYKVLHNILAVSAKLFIWKLSDSEMCCYCKSQSETVFHIFIECRVTNVFWKEVESLFNAICSTNLVFSDEMKLLGHPKGDSFLNYILVLSRYFIFKGRSEGRLSIEHFKGDLKIKCRIEKEIAKEAGDWVHFLEKWQKYINFFA